MKVMLTGLESQVHQKDREIGWSKF